MNLAGIHRSFRKNDELLLMYVDQIVLLLHAYLVQVLPPSVVVILLRAARHDLSEKLHLQHVRVLPI